MSNSFPERLNCHPSPVVSGRRGAVWVSAVLSSSAAIALVVALLFMHWNMPPSGVGTDASLAGDLAENVAASRRSMAATPPRQAESALAGDLPPVAIPVAGPPEERAASAVLHAAGVQIAHDRTAEGESFTRALFGSVSPSAPHVDHLPALRQMENLREVVLYDLRQPLGPQIETIAALPDVRALTVQYCQISPVGFAALATMDRLEALTLGNCELHDGDLEFLRSLPHLRSLRIDRCNPLSPARLQPLEATSSLRTLSLYGVPVTDDTLQRLRHNRQLQRLDIVSSERFTAAGFAALCDGSPLPDLETFRLANFPATGEFLATLQHTPNLRSLEIDDRGLTDEDYAKLPPLPELRNLELVTRWGRQPGLGRQPGQARLLGVAARFDKLEKLDCDVERIEPEQLRPLRGLERLTGLRLAAVVLDNELAGELARLPHLTELSIGRVDSARTTAQSLRQLQGVRTVWLCSSFGNADLLPLAFMPDLEAVWSVSGAIEPLSEHVLATFRARNIAIESVD